MKDNTDPPPGNGGKKALYTNPDRKPDVLAVNPDGIPTELKTARRWVLWVLVWKANKDGTGKWDKVPKRPDGRHAKSTDPATWTTFDAVWAAYRRGGFDGLGFVLGDGFAGIDLDDVRNPESGELVPWAGAWVGEANTYTEASPSGTGVKAFGRGEWRGDWHKRMHPSGAGEVEVYSAGRYFTVTGHALPDPPGVVNDLQPFLDAMTGAFTAGKSPTPPPPPAPPPGGGRLEDDELLDRIRGSAQGAKFARLWAGDAGEYGGDESRADLALCDLLAFWCGPDPDRIDRLVRQSKLYRAKWDDPRGPSTYGRRTIDKALADRTDFYDPTGGATFTATAAAGGTVPPAAPPPPWPDPPAEEAFYGLFGRIVRTVRPHTEADPAAVLLHAAVMFGNVIGRTAYHTVEDHRQYTNEFAVLVGATSSGKGTARRRADAVFRGLDDDWQALRCKSGLSSSEGLVAQVRDPLNDDPGEPDKRLLLLEEEWGSVVLKQNQRDGNTVSGYLRMAWDSPEVMGNLTKNPVQATAPHISLLGHTTPDELRRNLTTTEMANGYVNRHLIAAVRSAQDLPFGSAVPAAQLAPLRQELRLAAGFGQHAAEVPWAESARPLWAAVYPTLKAGRPGLAGELCGRARTHVLRLAVVYALADRSAVIRPAHLMAAVGVWDYCERSVLFLFGDRTGHPLADDIRRHLEAAPNGLTRTELQHPDVLGKHAYGDRLTAALDYLARAGLARRVDAPATGGRPPERWVAVHKAAGGSPLMAIARAAFADLGERGERGERDQPAAPDGSFPPFTPFPRPVHQPDNPPPSAAPPPPPDRPRVPDVVETWLAHQLWWGPKTKAELDRTAKAAGVGAFTRYVKVLHIQPRPLPGGGWEWELPAGLNRDLYPKPPDPPPPPPAPTLFDPETASLTEPGKPTKRGKKPKRKRESKGECHPPPE